MGTFTTQWMPRGTALFQPRDSLAPSSMRSSTLSTNTLSGHSLGDDTLGANAKGNKNPFQTYGRETSALIQAALKKAPPGQRGGVLKAILNKIDPKLYAQVKKTEKTGAPLGLAISQTMSQSIAKEIIDLGKGKSPTRAKQFSNAARSRHKATSGYVAVGGLISGLTGLISGTVDAIGSAGCKVANNKLTPAVAAGVSTAYGGGPQTGATGAVIAQSLCAKSPPPAPPQPFYEKTGFIVPAAVFGAGLILVVAIRKRSKS